MLALLALTSTGIELTFKWIVVIAGAMTAIGLICRYIWKGVRWASRFFALSRRAFEDIVGTSEQPSQREALQEVRGEVQEVRTIALRSEKELHPNTGSTLRDSVTDVGRRVDLSTEVGSRAAQRAEEAAREVQALGVASREASKKMQHDVTNIRVGQEGLLEMHDKLARRIEVIEAHHAERATALGDALIEQVDVALEAQEAR